MRIICVYISYIYIYIFLASHIFLAVFLLLEKLKILRGLLFDLDSFSGNVFSQGSGATQLRNCNNPKARTFSIVQ